MLIYTNFASSANTYNTSSLLQKFCFPIEVMFNSLQTQKGLELFFRLEYLEDFFIKGFLL